MKIAITADLHLTTRELNPERYETLENLLLDLRSENVQSLIIAGDLFDASRQNYAEFERVCRRPENQDLSIFVIPGNHDPGISSRNIVADNLTIMDTPSLDEIDGRPFLFLPYQPGKTMGDEIAQFRHQLPGNEWVLVGHGDWSVGLRKPDPLEPGVYMPLTRKDIEVYGPARVFLGHIHARMDESPVYYAGSPCGLDITETGRRRYLIYDTVTNQVESRTLETPVLYFDESFIILPVDDEIAYLLEQIEDRKKKWGLNPQEQAKAVLRVKVRGYSADKSAVRQALKEAFDGFSFYKGEEPDDSNISESKDRERQHVAEQVRASVEKLEWRADVKDEPDQHEILLEALHIIYGG